MVPGRCLRRRRQVAAYIEQFADQLYENGRWLVQHACHYEWIVLTAAGGVPVKPRSTDRRCGFRGVGMRKVPSELG